MDEAGRNDGVLRINRSNRNGQLMKVDNWSLFKSHLQRNRGHVQTYIGRGGIFVVAKWPRKRPGSLQPVTQQQVADFKQAALWAKTPLAADVQAAIQFPPSSGLYTRDLIETAMFGKHIIAYMSDGRVMMGGRDVSGNIQALLDQITTTPGAMLLRTAGGWYALDPSDTDGYVLTWSDADTSPEWKALPATPSSTGYNLALVSQVNTSSYTGNDATIGNIIIPAVDITVAAVWALLVTPSSATYEATLATMSGSTGTPSLTAILNQTSQAYSGDTTVKWIRIPLSEAVDLTAGTIYGVFMTRTDSTSSTALGTYEGAGTYAQMPFPGECTTGAYAANNGLAEGNDVNVSGVTNRPWAVGFEWILTA